MGVHAGKFLNGDLSPHEKPSTTIPEMGVECKRLTLEKVYPLIKGDEIV